MSSTPGSRARPGVFLDRDGTLVDELGYLTDPDRLRLFPRAADAVRRLNDAGLPVVLVTNQSGIARGMLTEERLAEIHRRLRDVLGEHGASLDAILFSPYHPDLGDDRYRRRTDCRKPAPGMLLEARDLLNLDLPSSWVVGDSERDLEAGRRAGVKRLVLVRTGKGGDTESGATEEQRESWRIVDDLAEAVESILAETGPFQGR